MNGQMGKGVGINFRAIFDQGSSVWAMIPGVSKQLLELKLEGVEQGGIWIQSQKLTDDLLRAMVRPSLEGTLVVFVPYSAIQYAVVLGEGVSLSAEKLGL